MRSIRRFLPLIMGVLILLLGGLDLWMEWNAWDRTGTVKDSATVMDERTALLRTALPAGVAVIGYVDSSMVPGAVQELDFEEFFLIQYSMAPTLLKFGLEQPWILGNFRSGDTSFRPWLDERLGAYEIWDFGFGLRLIHALDE
jgi:hypothetical protein